MPEAQTASALLEKVCGTLQSYGYEPGWTRRDFEIPVNNNGSGRWPVDRVIFCDATTSLVNAAFTIHGRVADPVALVEEKLSRTTAPFHVLVDAEKASFEFWAATKGDNRVRAQSIISSRPLTQLREGLEAFASDLAPSTLRQVKAGKASFAHVAFSEVRPIQLSLFVEEVTGRILTAHFAHVLADLRVAGRWTEDLVSALATELLAARVLTDVGALVPGRDLPATLHEARSKNLGNYFSSILNHATSPVLGRAFEQLGTVSFKTFTPDMLRGLYPAAFPREVRRAKGQYDTPLFLTQRILDNLPLEVLRPEQRQVADMTCGWGSFLVAAHRRLSSMPDLEPGGLSQVIVGNDFDPLTANLARFSLLLASGHNSWQVDHDDALQWPWLLNRQPGVIVGNPPFGADPDNLRGKDEVFRYVAHAVARLAEGGFLAMIVPASLKRKVSANSLRRDLFQNCDVWEMWEIPGGIFEDAAVQPIVLFARKNAGGGTGPAVVRRAGSSTSEVDALKAGHFTRSSRVNDNTNWLQRTEKTSAGLATAVLWTPLILSEERWTNLAARRLGDVAEVVNGMILGRKARRYHDYLYPQSLRILTNTKVAIRSGQDFYLDTASAVIRRYPNDFSEPGLGYKDRLFAKPKAVMTATASPQWGKVVKVGADRSGMFVSNSFWVFVPKAEVENPEGITAEVLAAVLRWVVVNGWICEYRDYPWISQPVLESAPFPPVQTPAFWMRVSEHVVSLRALAANRRWDLARERELDQMLRDAYGFQNRPQDLAALEAIYHWREGNDTRKVLSDPPPPPAPNSPLLVAGHVESVDAATGTLTAWVDALADCVELPITPTLPGWLLRAGAAFKATLLRVAKDQGKRTGSGYELVAVSGQAYSYLDLEEAHQVLTERLHRATEVES